MSLNWWRGIRRTYVAASVVWIASIGVVGWLSRNEMMVPLYDERALASLDQCAPKEVNTKGLFADRDYAAIPTEEKLEVLRRLCPRADEVYKALSASGRDQLLMGVGIYPSVPKSGMTPGLVLTIRRLATMAGFGLAPPVLLYVGLVAGRWILRGFRSDAMEKAP